MLIETILNIILMIADLKLPASYTLRVARRSDHMQGFSTDI